jgi:hypothetical protein
MNSPDVINFPLNDGILLIGRGAVIPPTMHRFALLSKAEIRAHLSRIQTNPLAMRQLRELVARMTTRAFYRDMDLITYLVDTAASPQHQLLVIDLGHNRFTIRTSNAVVSVTFNTPAPLATSVVRGAGNLQPVSDVRQMSLEDRFMEVIKRLPKFLPAAAGAEIQALFSKGALAMLIGTLVVWAGAHYVGVGEAIDVLLVAVGFAFLGLQIFDVAKYLVKCIMLTIDAKTEADLDAASELLAKVIAIIGITALLTLITKTAGKKFARTAGKEATTAEKAATGKPKPKAKAEPEPAVKPKVEATPKQRATLDEMYKKGPAAKTEIDGKAQQVADEFGGKVAKAPLKSEKRVLEKANDDYGGDVGRVKDVARNTVVVDEKNKLAALDSLKEKYPGLPENNVTVVDAAKDPLGYSGVKVNVPTKTGMTAETQINSPEMIFAKEKPADARAILGNDVYDGLASKPGMPEGGLGHKYYEEYRVLPDKSTPEAQALAQESRSYYDAVRGAAKGGG